MALGNAVLKGVLCQEVIITIGILGQESYLYVN